MLVDGTLADNCPTAPFAELEEGPVVAVRIASGVGDPHESRTPSLGETLLRIVQMGDRGARLDEPQATAVATVTVTPDAAGVGLLEFHQLEQARDAGLRAGEEAIAALREATRDGPPYQWRSAHSPASS